MQKLKTRKTEVAIVTGGAGFIGSHIVDELVKRRIKVHVIDDLSSGYRVNLNPNVQFHHVSIMSPAVHKIFEKVKPDYLFHLAAQISVRRSIQKPITDAKINILGMVNVLEAARKAGVKKIIAMSSGGIMYPSTLKRAKETDRVYPEAPYGIAKRALELYLEHYRKVFGIPYVALRLSNVYGPRQRMSGTGEGGVIAIFAEMLLRGHVPFMTWKGRQTRDYVYVADVANAAMLAMKSNFVGHVNISSCAEVSVQKIFDIMTGMIGIQVKPIYKPAIKGEKKRSCMDNGLARKKLGWTPKVSLEEGLSRTISFHKRELGLNKTKCDDDLKKAN
jgi:UDP-glucose 4-epimerase